jgi:hypothetical protein
MALRACRRLIKAIKVVREYSDNENDDEVAQTFTMEDEDEIMTHMLDCVALLAAMQSKMQEDNSANSADARTLRNKVFMAALSTVGGSLLNIDNKEQPMQITTAAIGQLLKAFPIPDYSFSF